MRDYRKLLEPVRCWDAEAQRIIESRDLLPDVVLQNREELIRFCEWLEQEQIRSFLEIGIWTGRLTVLLQELFQFEKLAICDMRFAQMNGYDMRIPHAAQTFWGSSHSIEYMAWRRELGHMDVVLIDGDHTYEGVKQDFLINQRYPHRFLVFHDILGSNHITEGVARFWDELEGNKLVIAEPNPEAGLETSNMGIGIWWSD